MPSVAKTLAATGENIKLARLRRKLSAEQVAERANISRPTLLSIEKGGGGGDQHFWATIAYKKGIALKPVPLKKLTDRLLIDNARKLLSTEPLYANSIELSRKIKTENGVKKAIDLIEKNFP